MNIFSLLNVVDSDIEPKQTKIHLASNNSTDSPLEVFLHGKFDEWQRWQSKRNFQRPFVISLIQLPAKDTWLFAGCYDSTGYSVQQKSYYYSLTPRTATESLAGRLTVDFQRSGRQSYLNAENWFERITLNSIYEKRLEIEEFPGYRNVLLTKQQLDLIIGRSIDSWRAALSNVNGIYLITDTSSGKHYVGKADGSHGIWGRWSSYSANGHGDNMELRHLMQSNADHSRHFQFSILEITDLDTPEDQILNREAFWKRVLVSGEFGLNRN